jgi:hypothetical protein
MSEGHPIARSEKMVVQELQDEVLVFDLETSEAHCLNSMARFVWNVCDGNHSISDIRELIGKKFRQDVGEDFVWLALDTLKTANLLQNGNEFIPDFAGASRRKIIRQLGLASMIALPIVSSIVAPPAIAAASTCGGTCTSNANCSALCPTCVTSGRCGGSPINPCSNIGGLCTENGNCFQNFNGVCSTGGFCSTPGPCLSQTGGGIGTCIFGFTCSAPGGTCTGPGTCSGSSICIASGPGTCH